jgi:UDP-N-acetylglucosamine--N-acetylmuramyl-(pentapeptide) pyrophosphoryl-undecaprenol N-acetylglucosamine transferase
LLICAGGTGGGVYPAIAVLKALGSEAEPVLWVGSQGGLEADLVKRAGIPYTAIPAGGVHLAGSDLLRLPGNILRLGRGYFTARKILREFQPDVLFFTGGFVAVPMGLAGRNLPSLLFVPDIEPGMALKALEAYADCVATTSAETRHFLSHRTRMVATGYPLRPELVQWDPEMARDKLNLCKDRPILLVIGGSKGTRSINNAIFHGLKRLLAHCQVLHITGQANWAEVEGIRAGLEEAEAAHYHPHPYLHDDVAAAFSVANLVISRSGASTLGEYPAFGLPAILVPYPYAWRYQKVNAAYLEEQGAAITILDENLEQNLVDTVLNLLNDPHRLLAMRSAMRSLATPAAAHSLADLVRELAELKNGSRRGGK